MSGGNIFVYEQLMEQKMMLQMLMMRQQTQTQQATRRKVQRVAEPAAIVRMVPARTIFRTEPCLPGERRKHSPHPRPAPPQPPVL